MQENRKKSEQRAVSDLIGGRRVLGIFRIFALFFCTLTLLSACKEDKPPAPAHDPSKPVMRILFVGNDFTFMNNMPYMIQAFAQNDPSAHFNVEVHMHVAQGASLAQLWNAPGTKDLLISQKWDYIVMQPHHMWASSDGSVYLTQKSIAAWNSQIGAVGAMPVLFMTWPLEPSHSAYGNPKYPQLQNYKNMHRMIRGYTKSLSEKYGLLDVPVGDYWVYAMAQNPDVALYNPDRYSPTLAGSYLTALIFYKMLVDKTLDDIRYTPEGLPPDAQAALIRIASEKI